jgi:hypothetical protein
MNYEYEDGALYAQEEAREYQAFLDAQVEDARLVVEKTRPEANFRAACIYAANLVLFRVETEDHVQWTLQYGAQPIADGAHVAADLKPSDVEIDALEASVRERLRAVDPEGPWSLEIHEVQELLELSSK